MNVYVLVGRSIYNTSTICKMQKTANMTKTTFVAQIELSQIVYSIFQIEHSICDTQLLFTINGYTNRGISTISSYSRK